MNDIKPGSKLEGLTVRGDAVNKIARARSRTVAGAQDRQAERTGQPQRAQGSWKELNQDEQDREDLISIIDQARRRTDEMWRQIDEAERIEEEAKRGVEDTR
ncbi:hypothetical protein DENSPDRAFT_690857 [Dentipellis sp. KUC8613]|nr:hypothetical protein DENSPDRAFT_690857 [Dentipellis sp. KUC8613]